MLEIKSIKPQMIKTTLPIKKKKAASEHFLHEDDTQVDQFSSAAKMALTSLSIDPLFAQLNDQGDRQRAVMAGLQLLDELDKLRAMLLNGQAQNQTILTLEQIKTQVEQLSSIHPDPQMQHILLEIETRAVVELAKLGR